MHTLNNTSNLFNSLLLPYYAKYLNSLIVNEPKIQKTTTCNYKLSSSLELLAINVHFFFFKKKNNNFLVVSSESVNKKLNELILFMQRYKKKQIK